MKKMSAVAQLSAAFPYDVSDPARRGASPGLLSTLLSSMKIKAITQVWVALLAISVAPGAIAATSALLSVSGIYSFGEIV
jgi:hypothetical protein